MRATKLLLLVLLVDRGAVLLFVVTVFPRTRSFDILSVSEPRSGDVPPRICKLDIMELIDPRSSSVKACDVLRLRAKRRTGDWMIVVSKRTWRPWPEAIPPLPLCTMLVGMYGLAQKAEDEPIDFAVAFALCFMTLSCLLVSMAVKLSNTYWNAASKIVQDCEQHKAGRSKMM